MQTPFDLLPPFPWEGPPPTRGARRRERRVFEEFIMSWTESGKQISDLPCETLVNLADLIRKRNWSVFLDRTTIIEEAEKCRRR